MRKVDASRKAEAGEAEQSDDIFGGIRSYRQRIADKLGPQSNAPGSLFQSRQN